MWILVVIKDLRIRRMCGERLYIKVNEGFMRARSGTRGCINKDLKKIGADIISRVYMCILFLLHEFCVQFMTVLSGNRRQYELII